ncbi:hypothetical protein F8M41_009800 [Gigaspora margarita]|uniref:Uncharacterized protein n=1 Tax=Gigaspora margarita TaxID=4874 RepID=A0A8H3X355_GIGMA|nr:hypothetical protein F8M41_009800 [Gigaspora margarita]
MEKVFDNGANQHHWLLIFEKDAIQENQILVYCKRAGTLQEILYEEASSPFIKIPNKAPNDLYKLFQFGCDSKVMMTTRLILDNIRYLSDYEKLWKTLRDIELFLLQAYGESHIS